MNPHSLQHSLQPPPSINHHRPQSVAAAMSSLDTAPSRIGKLLPDETALLVCDVQERFRPIISNFTAVVDTSRRMVCFFSSFFSSFPHSSPLPLTSQSHLLSFHSLGPCRTSPPTPHCGKRTIPQSTGHHRPRGG